MEPAGEGDAAEAGQEGEYIPGHTNPAEHQRQHTDQQKDVDPRLGNAQSLVSALEVL